MAMAKIKRHLTRQEEFDILKLILDKFLWLGVLIMAYGFYRLVSASEDLTFGLAVMVGGAILLFIFMTILVREYHFMKS
jgi:hypothetical protein